MSLTLFGFGTGPVVVAMVLGIFAGVGVVIALLISGLTALGCWLMSRRVPAWQTVATSVAAAAASGPLYMWAYGERFTFFWLTPLLLGAAVAALMVHTAALLLRRDAGLQDSEKPPKLQLQTMLLLVAVFGTALATLAPAFAAQ